MKTIYEILNWRIDKKNSFFANRSNLIIGDDRIIVLEHYNDNEEERNRYEKLISAAPDLLEALQIITAQFETLGNHLYSKDKAAIEKAKQAIKKATE